MKQIDSEIEYEKQNKPNEEEGQALMKKNGWNVKSDGATVELSKQVGDKSIFITFPIRSPPEEPENEQD